MKVNISGEAATLRVHFTPPSRWGRQTVVTLVLPDGTPLQGVSTCASSDNFCRFTGKRLAVERLLYSTTNGWHGGWVATAHRDPHLRRFVPLPLAARVDRAAVWAAVLGPRYAAAKWAAVPVMDQVAVC